MIDNILINKTASPDLPGDFSGGVIQILTKDIPFKNFFSVSVGAGYNSLSTGKDFRIGQLRNTDYLGYDDGTRLLPAKFPGRNRFLSYNSDASPDRRLAASRLLRNNYGERYSGNALPSMNLQATWGGRKGFKNGATIGSVVALTYRHTQSMQRLPTCFSSITIRPIPLALTWVCWPTSLIKKEPIKLYSKISSTACLMSATCIAAVIITTTGSL